MVELARVEIDKLFTGLQWNTAKESIQYCGSCNTVFVADWAEEHKCGRWRWYGSSYYCPHCGELQEDKLYRTKTDLVDISVPLSITIKLVKHKYVIELIVSGRSVRLYKSSMYKAYGSDFTERFRFDIKTKQVQFNKENIESLLNSNLEHRSMLAYLTHNSFAFGQKAEIVALLKKLRESIQGMHKQIHGYTFKAAHTHSNDRQGLMLPQINNLVWRLACTDAPNMHEINSQLAWSRQPQLRDQGYLTLFCATEERAQRYVRDIMMKGRSGLSYPQSVIKALKLPDCAAYRSIIAQAKSPFFPIMLKWCAQVSQSTNDAVNLYKFMIEHTRYSKFENTNYLRFLLKIKRNFSTDVLLDFLKHTLQYKACGDRPWISSDLRFLPKATELGDCTRMYFGLTKDNKQKFLSSTVQGSAIHDQLVAIYKVQTNPDYSLQVPEHVKRRLAMQLDSINFYLPETKHQLLRVGSDLHNCVGSYSDRIVAGSSYIVAMTDDNGKLSACIQVSRNRITQAKLNQNRPVRDSAVVNQAILDWAKKAELSIDTVDILAAKDDTGTVAV